MDDADKKPYERLNDAYEEWFDTLRAELSEGGDLPEHERSEVHLEHGLAAIERKIAEVRETLQAITSAKAGWG